MVSKLMLFLIAVVVSLSSKAEKVWIDTGHSKLAGHYIPTQSDLKSKGVAIFVHGDGPLNFDAEGYYRPIWELFLDNGYAILSWDKPGVGNSEGDWQFQSMKDRQVNVESAISLLRHQYGFTIDQIGIIGFSQAGWVIPQVANKHKRLRFIIGVGIALNWKEQSWYLTRTQLEQEKASISKIRRSYQNHISEFKLLEEKPSYERYLRETSQKSEVVSEKRYHFLLRNYKSDSRQPLSVLSQPTLVLLGQKDRNTDVAKTYRHLKKVLNPARKQEVFLLKDATHGLLKYPEFDGEINFLFWLRLILLEDEAFADGFLDTIERFINTL